ncbi:hypothetical protein Agub_g1421, partial [Astrephomene gubernaculifera]
LFPLDPTTSRVDAIYAFFPCSSSYTQQLLYTLRAGAFIDPWVKARVWDYGNLAYAAGQLLTLAVAAAAPSLYERWRHGLFVVHSASILLGWWASAVAAPAQLLPLLGAVYIGGVKRRVGAVYFAWKALTVHRLPSRLQLLSGPALWLLALPTMAAVDRRLAAPPAGPLQHNHLD